MKKHYFSTAAILVGIMIILSGCQSGSSQTEEPGRSEEVIPQTVVSEETTSSIAADFAAQNDFLFTTAKVNVRMAASEESGIFTTLEKGTRVVRTGCDDRWSWVEMEGHPYRFFLSIWRRSLPTGPMFSSMYWGMGWQKESDFTLTEIIDIHTVCMLLFFM